MEQKHVWMARHSFKIALDLLKAKKEGRKTIKVSDIHFWENEDEFNLTMALFHDLFEELRWDLKSAGSAKIVVGTEDGIKVRDLELSQGDSE